jgi:hypothetical protein
MRNVFRFHSLVALCFDLRVALLQLSRSLHSLAEFLIHLAQLPSCPLANALLGRSVWFVIVYHWHRHLKIRWLSSADSVGRQARARPHDLHPTGECHQLSLEGSPYRSVHKEEKKRVFDTVACGRKGRLVTLCNSYGLSLAWPTIKTCLSVTTMKVVDHDAVPSPVRLRAVGPCPRKARQSTLCCRNRIPKSSLFCAQQSVLWGTST